MPVYSVSRLNDSETASRQGSTDSYAQGWTVVIGAADNLAVAMEAAGLPKTGSTYGRAFFESASVRSVTRTSDARKVVAIECRFSTAVLPDVGKASGNPNDGSQIPDPLQRPPVRRWRGTTYDTYPEHDLTGAAIVNAAGEPFGEPIAVPESVGVLSIVRNEASFDNAKMAFYRNALNAEEFYGWPRWKVKCLPPSADEMHENGVTFVQVSYEFHFRETGWKVIKLNQGSYFNPSGATLMERDSRNGEAVADNIFTQEPHEAEGRVSNYFTPLNDAVEFPLDKHGTRTGAMVLLDEKGRRLPQGSRPTYRSFWVCGSTSFKPLHLEW